MALLVKFMALPVPAKQPKAAFAAETGWMSHRMSDFELSRANAGMSVERVALIPTPIGHVTIAFLESTTGYRDIAKTIRTTPTVFDKDMMMRGKVLHGLSEAQQKEKRVALDTAVLRRVPGNPRLLWHSFAALVRSEAVERWLAFRDTLADSRAAGMQEFGGKHGMTVFCAGLYATDGGTVACYYVEGSDDNGFLPNAITVGGEFESWFAEELEAVHGSDIRDGLPSPTIAKRWDLVQGEPNDEPAPPYASVARMLGE